MRGNPGDFAAIVEDEPSPPGICNRPDELRCTNTAAYAGGGGRGWLVCRGDEEVNDDVDDVDDEQPFATSGERGRSCC